MSLQCCINGCTKIVEFPPEYVIDVLPKGTKVRSIEKDCTEKWAVCPEHYEEYGGTEQEPDPIIDKICRICLTTDMKLLSISNYKLDIVYEELTGVCLDEDTLPKYLCVECAQRLINCSRFKEKSLRGHITLVELADSSEDEQIRLSSLKHMKRRPIVKKLSSCLAKKDIGVDYFDVYIKDDSDLLFKTEESIAEETCAGGGTKYKTENDLTEMKAESNGDDNFIDIDDNTVLILNVQDEENEKGKKKGKKKEVSPTKQEELEKRAKSLLQREIDLSNFTVAELTLEEQIAELRKREKNRFYLNAMFKCTYCYRGYNFKETYDNHMLKHSDVCGKVECPVCHLRFHYARHQRTHSKNIHKNRYTCNQCLFSTLSSEGAMLHSRMHRGVRYTCSHCEATFKFRTTYMSHVRIKHPSDFACDLCGYSFLSKTGVIQHKFKSHRLASKEIPEDGPFCDQCNIRFVSEEALLTHLSVSPKHTDSDSSHKRNERVQVKRNKMNHKMTRTCKQCGEELVNSQAFHKHLRDVHNYTKPKKRSTDRSSTVNDTKKHYVICETCGKQFPSRTTLKDHQWVHTGEKSHRCEICNNYFTCKLTLKNHVKLHLGIRETYQCKLCERKFTSLGNRNKHMRLFHSDVRPFKCDMCDKYFKSREHVRAHTSHVHLHTPWPKRNRGKRTATSTSVQPDKETWVLVQPVPSDAES